KTFFVSLFFCDNFRGTKFYDIFRDMKFYDNFRGTKFYIFSDTKFYDIFYSTKFYKISLVCRFLDYQAYQIFLFHAIDMWSNQGKIFNALWRASIWNID